MCSRPLTIWSHLSSRHYLAMGLNLYAHDARNACFANDGGERHHTVHTMGTKYVYVHMCSREPSCIVDLA